MRRGVALCSMVCCGEVRCGLVWCGVVSMLMQSCVKVLHTPRPKLTVLPPIPLPDLTTSGIVTESNLLPPTLNTSGKMKSDSHFPAISPNFPRKPLQLRFLSRKVDLIWVFILQQISSLSFPPCTVVPRGWTRVNVADKQGGE